MDSPLLLNSDSPLSEERSLMDRDEDDALIDEQQPDLKSELEHLGVGLADQDSLEQQIMAEVDMSNDCQYRSLVDPHLLIGEQSSGGT
jgi:hypothetical protein